jgi:hypothetical protein
MRHQGFALYFTIARHMIQKEVGLKNTSRRDRSGQVNHGQNQSFFLAPVNTTARLSSRILG